MAQPGGFLGRKADGEPGVPAIWRGWQRLQDLADTWAIVVHDRTRLVGNR
ncbi:MAG: IS4 family transposase [Chloroflexi bacterium]|nr:IS4 family transposase [Chloroflexota bacterium]